MWKLSLPFLLLMAAPAFGQHTLTISATRSSILQPDQVLFSLSVSSSAAATLDQIVAALSGLDITSSNLSGVINNPTPPMFQWNFTLLAPLSSLTATIGSMTKFQQTITQNNSGLTLTFYVDGTEVSQQLRQSQSCSNSDLIADATAQAQKVSAAAGLTLGPILSLSNTPLPQPTLVYATNEIVGEIVPNNFLVGYVSPVTCSLYVEFRLLP
jgi:hypothetical protein